MSWGLGGLQIRVQLIDAREDSFGNIFIGAGSLIGANLFFRQFPSYRSSGISGRIFFLRHFQTYGSDFPIRHRHFHHYKFQPLSRFSLLPLRLHSYCDRHSWGATSSTLMDSSGRFDWLVCGPILCRPSYCNRRALYIYQCGQCAFLDSHRTYRRHAVLFCHPRFGCSQ